MGSPGRSRYASCFILFSLSNVSVARSARMEQNSAEESAAPVDEPADVAGAAPCASQPLKRGRQTHCFAPGCKSGKNGRRRDPDGRRHSIFRMPRDEEMFRRWQRYVPPRNDGKKLKPESVLCERHFDPQFVVRYFEHNIQGDVVRIPRGYPILTPDAVPTVFPESPKYYTRRVPRRRKPPQRAPLPPPKPKRTNAADASTAAAPGDANVETVSENGPEEGALEPSAAAVPDICEEHIVECEVTPAFPYEDLQLPSRQWARHVISEKPLVIAYSTCRVCDDEPGRLETEKLVLVREYEDHAECCVYLDGQRLRSFEGAGGTDYPWTLLERLDQVKRCPGFGDIEQYPLAAKLPFVETRRSRLHSAECAGVSNSRGGMSEKCHLVKVRLRKRQLRMERRRRAQNFAGGGTQAVIVKFTEAPPCSGPVQVVMVTGQKDIAADVAASASNEEVAEEVVLDKTESSCSGNSTSKNNGSPSVTQLEDAEAALPYETVISGPAPIYVI